MELLLIFTYTSFFIFIIHKLNFFEIDGISRKTISAIFLLKIIFGFVLWAVYTFYYTNKITSDIYKYFDDSKIIYDAIKANPIDYFKILFGIGNNTPEFHHYYAQMNYWARQIDSSIYNDSHTIIRFNAFARLFSFGYYNVHTVFICFLSLIGLTAIYKTFVMYLQDKKRELLIAVFLLPSVLFWGSGVLKEGLIFFALGLLIYYSTKLFSLKSILICLSMTFLLAFSKFYVWLSILPSIVFLIWLNKSTAKKIILKFSIVLILIAIVGLNIDKFTNIQNPLVTLSQKQWEFNQLASGKLTDANNTIVPIANSAIHINELQPTLFSFIKNSPEAFLNTFFRPYVWELKSPMMLMAGIENLLILIFVIICIFFRKALNQIKWEYVLFCLSFVLIQFLIIGETTPILGAVARYKTIAFPFLLIAFLFVLDKNKLPKLFK